MKSFSKWSIKEVEKEFGIKLKKKSTLLDEWLVIHSPLSSFEKQWLEYIRNYLEEYGFVWKEQDLIANFIGPLLTLVNFNHDAYRGFSISELSAPYGDETLSGEVDYVVAQGQYDPERLFFFLHEYKKEHDNRDPRGQLLIAMIAAQLLNNDDNPIYGVYVVGHMWYFVILDSKEYTVHRRGFNALTKEIEQIFGVLRNTKPIIERWLTSV